MTQPHVRILLVEDNPGDVRLLVECLAETSLFTYSIETADCLAEAVRLARAGESDVVLLDLSLPDCTGLGTVREVQSAGCGLPIVILTGSDDEALALSALKNGAQDYLVKRRIAPWLLAKSILYAIERHRFEDSLAKSEQRFQDLIKASFDGIAIMVDEKIAKASPSFALMLGHQPGDVEGLWVTDIIGQNALLASALRDHRDGSAGPLEAQVRKKDGSLLYVEGFFKETTFEGKSALICGIRDISSRKQAERELTASRRQHRDLARHVVAAREDERARIARGIHDEFGGQLTGLAMDASWIRRHCRTDVEAAERRLESMATRIQETIETVQRISSDLRPAFLDHLGLVPAIEWQALQFQKRAGIRCRMKLPDEDLELHPRLETDLFRVLQEALTNVMRHARATSADVGLEVKDGSVLVSVDDDGCGIEEGAIWAPEAYGLIGMRERAASWGGSVAISRGQHRGTVVRATVPVVLRGDDADPRR